MSQTIRAPVDRVFQIAVQLDEFPAWSPHNSWARKLTEDEVGKRTRFEMGIKGFGKITNELREFEPNRRVIVAPIIRMLSGGRPTTARAPRTKIGRSIRIGCAAIASRIATSPELVSSPASA